jgi:hypothetical protein
MNHLLRPRIWPSFLASSGIGPCDVPLRYASEPIPRYRGTVARWHAHLRGLATAIHEISGLAEKILNLFSFLQFGDPWLRKVFLAQISPKDHTHRHSSGGVVTAGYDSLDESFS